MQKRKGLRRDRRRVTFACAAVLALFAVGPLADPAAAGIWSDAPFGGLAAWRFLGLGDSARVAFAFLSAANPYSIEGLLASTLVAEIETRPFGVEFDWRRLSHELYREDRLWSAAAARLPVLGISAGLECSLARRRAEGFPVERSRSLGLFAGLGRGSPISLRFAVPFVRRGARVRDCPRWSCGVRTRSFDVGVSRFCPDGTAMDWRIEAIAPVGERAGIRSSYSFRAGELSIGFLVEIGRLAVGISWDVNPALGSGLAAGVGRRWGG